MLAAMNTASEYGFGGVIASLPSFAGIQNALSDTFTNPLVNGAVVTNVLSGITGSGSGGMSMVLSVMADKYIEAANALNIPLEALEVTHRIMAMAAGGIGPRWVNIVKRILKKQESKLFKSNLLSFYSCRKLLWIPALGSGCRPPLLTGVSSINMVYACGVI